MEFLPNRQGVQSLVLAYVATSFSTMVILVAVGISESQPVLLIGGITPMLVGSFVWWHFLATRYRVEDSHLMIRRVLFPQRTSLGSILQISRVPAGTDFWWSVDRLRVTYRAGRKNKSFVICPADPQSLLDAVARQDPDLVATADGLTRTNPRAARTATA